VHWLRDQQPRVPTKARNRQEHFELSGKNLATFLWFAIVRQLNLRQLKKSWPGHRPEFALRWFAGLLAA
jgi:hypothetical protein